VKLRRSDVDRRGNDSVARLQFTAYLLRAENEQKLMTPSRLSLIFFCRLNDFLNSFVKSGDAIGRPRLCIVFASAEENGLLYDRTILIAISGG